MRNPNICILSIHYDFNENLCLNHTTHCVTNALIHNTAYRKEGDCNSSVCEQTDMKGRHANKMLMIHALEYGIFQLTRRKQTKKKQNRDSNHNSEIRSDTRI